MIKNSVEKLSKDITDVGWQVREDLWNIKWILGDKQNIDSTVVILKSFSHLCNNIYIGLPSFLNILNQNCFLISIEYLVNG